MLAWGVGGFLKGEGYFVFEVLPRGRWRMKIPKKNLAVV